MRQTLLCLFFCLYAVIGNAQQNISREAAMADIDTLVMRLERVHYNPYLYTTRKKFTSAVADMKSALRDSIAFNDLLVKMYQLTAMLQDAHTMPNIVQPELLPELRKTLFLPLKYFTYDGQVYTATGDSFLAGGSQIISVNGVNVNKLLHQASYMLGGTPGYKEQFSTRLLPYFLYLKGVQPPFTVEYMSNRHAAKIMIKEGHSFGSVLAAQMPHIRQHYSFRIIDDKVGYLNFMSDDDDLNKWGLFLDSAFTQMRQKGIKTLCIDIRNNSGGNSLYGECLLAYITKKKFSMSSGKCWKISADYKQYQKDNGGIIDSYQARQDGTMWIMEQCEPDSPRFIADTVFMGKVYVLTGGFTFSSANMMADAVKTYSMATVVGAPTGEYTNDFGELMTTTLPNSHIKMQITTSFDYGADCNKKSHRPVIPDIPVQSTYKDMLNGIDVSLQYVIDHANK